MPYPNPCSAEPNTTEGVTTMSIAICRCDKCSSAHDVAGMQIHDRRECEHSNSNPDIDFTRKNDNYCLCDKAITQVTDKSTGEVIREIIKSYNQVIDEQIAERYTVKKAVRKDAVRMVTFIFTSDEAFFADKSLEEQRKYFQSCLEWAENRYGKANILSAHVHMDEKTPHMHLNVIPLVTTKNKKDEEVVTLSAKAMLNGGGSKAMQALQDSFYEAVGKPYGMERGTRADLDDPNRPKPRKHQRVGEYKSNTQYHKQEQAKAEKAVAELTSTVSELTEKENALKTEVTELGERKNALQGNVQALQEQEQAYIDILHTEPQTLTEGVSVPSIMTKLLKAEDRNKLLYPPEEVEKFQEIAKSIAVETEALEVRTAELDKKAAQLAEQEKKLKQREESCEYVFNRNQEIDKALTEREEQLDKRESMVEYDENYVERERQRLQEREQVLYELENRPDAYYQDIINARDNRIKELKAEVSDLERTEFQLGRTIEELTKASNVNIRRIEVKLSEKENELTALKADNDSLKSRVSELEREIEKHKDAVNNLSEKLTNLQGLYDTAYECADYICNKVNLDFSKVLDMRIDNYRLSYIVDEGHAR